MVLLLVSGSAFAGSLQPTAAPGPTMKPLSAIEPRVSVQSLSGSATSMYVISESGSYYLTANINADPNKNGIEITCDNVTVDLKGFSINGAGKSVGSTGSGIRAYDINQITIQNGFIGHFRDRGINAESSINLTVENVVVEDCYYGIYGGMNCTIQKCKSSDNTTTGIYAGQGLITGCSSYNNAVTGIYASTGCTISNNVVYNNREGIKVSSGCYIHHNNISGSSLGAGIKAHNDFNVIENNIVTGCYYGLDLNENESLYLNNRLGSNGIDYYNENYSTDGGGNIEF